MTESRELKFKIQTWETIRFMSRQDIFLPWSPEATASVRHEAMQVNAWKSTHSNLCP